jgi:hypothetical protein
MTPALRKLTITAHVTFSVGWLGAVGAFLVLSIAGLTSHDADVVRGAYLSMDLISRFIIIPMCFAALITGLLQTFATPWGLFRYYWIVLKFELAIFATFALLVHQFVVVAEAAKRVSGAAAETLFNADLSSLKTELVRAPMPRHSVASRGYDTRGVQTVGPDPVRATQTAGAAQSGAATCQGDSPRSQDLLLCDRCPGVGVRRAAPHRAWLGEPRSLI